MEVTQENVGPTDVTTKQAYTLLMFVMDIANNWHEKLKAHYENVDKEYLTQMISTELDMNGIVHSVEKVLLEHDNMMFCAIDKDDMVFIPMTDSYHTLCIALNPKQKDKRWATSM